MSRCPTRCIRERATGFHEAGHAIVVFFLAAVFCGLLASLRTASAEITERGLGILYGSDHAFALRAPNGWMLDNESGVEQGLYAVFYPKGTNWRDSVVVAYARARERTQEIASADDAVRDTIDDFHASGSRNYRLPPERGALYQWRIPAAGLSVPPSELVTALRRVWKRLADRAPAAVAAGPAET